MRDSSKSSMNQQGRCTSLQELPVEKESQPVIRNGKVQPPTPEQTALLISKRRSIFTKDLSGETIDRHAPSKTLDPYSKQYTFLHSWTCIALTAPGRQIRFFNLQSCHIAASPASLHAFSKHQFRYRTRWSFGRLGVDFTLAPETRCHDVLCIFGK